MSRYIVKAMYLEKPKCYNLKRSMFLLVCFAKQSDVSINQTKRTWYTKHKEKRSECSIIHLVYCSKTKDSCKGEVQTTCFLCAIEMQPTQTPRQDRKYMFINGYQFSNPMQFEYILAECPRICLWLLTCCAMLCCTAQVTKLTMIFQLQILK